MGKFTGYIQESCSELLRNLADALSVRIVVLDETERQIVEIVGSERDGERGETSLPAITSTIETSEKVCGYLSMDAPENLRPLLDSLAAEISKRFELEQDIDGMTGDLMESFDTLNLLYKSSEILRRDGKFSKNVRHLMEDTADLFDERLLVLYLPKATETIWPEMFDFSRSEALAWLERNPDQFHQVLKDTQIALGFESADAGERHQAAILTSHGRIEYIAIPLRIRSNIEGFVGIFRDNEEVSLESGEVRLAETLAEELSNAATTQELNQELRQLLFSVVRSLVAAIEAKDPYTRGHSDRVVQLSSLIAEHLDLPESSVQLLSWTAILHDVGKISIKDGILNKKGSLTDAEYEIIKGHPAAGATMLKPIAQLYAVLPGIRHHHERFDGTGYPDGLTGEKIPLFARIIAVADTFDAVVTTRPYRLARGSEKAIQIIRDGIGTQFDPQVAAAFFELVDAGALEKLMGDVPESVGS